MSANAPRPASSVSRSAARGRSARTFCRRCPSTRTPTTRRTRTAIAQTTASTVTTPAPRPSSSPAISASRSSCPDAAASRPTSTNTAYARNSTHAPAIAREVDSRLSSPMSGASTPPRARWNHDAAVSTPAVTSAASSPAVRAAVHPAPIAVSACTSSSTTTSNQTTDAVRHHSPASHTALSARPRSATSSADCVSSSDTHCREADAEWATAAGSPRPAANSSRFSRNSATARRCPARAPCGQSPRVQPPPCTPIAVPPRPASCTATPDARLPRDLMPS